MKLVKHKFFILLLCLFSLTGFAQSRYENVEVELVTIGVGPNYWEAFGHSAIRLKSPAADYMYGFGYFDFNEEDFFLKFIMGNARYFLGIEATEIEFEDAINHGRAIWTQKLDLHGEEKIKLINKLNSLARPENRYYHYDYFRNNCTSRIRDILDDSVEGEIFSKLHTIENSRSWYDLTFPARNQSWMNLGIAIAYGMPAYQKRNQWQLSVFPDVFAVDMDTLKEDWIGPLQQIYTPESKSIKFNGYSFTQTHFAMIFLVSVLISLLYYKKTSAITTRIWLVIQSLVGLGLLFLWFFTSHEAASVNFNILLFFPLAFLMLFKTFRSENILSIYMVLNTIWLIIAIFFTSLYLFGFMLINLVAANNLKMKAEAISN